MLLAVILAILLIVGVIWVHEGGHFLAAMILGIPVRRIVFGFPVLPKKEFMLGSRQLCVSPWILVMGVEIDDAVFWSLSLKKKTILALSGPAMNIAVGLVSAILVLGLNDGLKVVNEFLYATFGASASLVNGSVGLDQLVSTVGVISLSAKAIAIDLVKGSVFIWLLVNFAIASMNILPVPAFDGGQILVAVFVRFFNYHPRAIKVAKIVTRVSLWAAVFFVLLLMVKDVVHLI